MIYFDGQFDDSRLLINLIATASEQGAVLLNYAQVTGLSKDSDGFVNGVTVRDVETGEEFEAPAKVVINATGPFTDDLRRKADPSVQPMIAPSQGIHLVFDGVVLAGDNAIMVPHTSDGRVMFAIPWHGHTLVGTTDTPVAEAALEPVAQEQEIDFVLQTASLYLAKKPERSDVTSVFAGIRPLVRAEIPPIPRRSRAATPFASRIPAWSPSAAASGPPIATWRKTASTRPPYWGAWMAKIFEAGFTTSAGSPGLGLALAKKVVEQHQGKIGVESDTEKGTAFTLSFPRLEDLNQPGVPEIPSVLGDRVLVA